ncbi:GNAT family N-acetyltransferase [Rhodohalobacter mucosus]|uniref:GNAT family N-acetyltransferase n=1 Tax=Rhodohalobacter mucosus TaxID=2079485 RepID=A0A316TQ57_9BACT|nr:GNAT family N-acetyltransferase [Rhodohalobacter mucosus]
MTNHLNLTIRKGTRADASTIAEFNIAMALETEGKKLDRRKIESGVRGLMNNPNYGFYLVAVYKEQVVGSLMITFEWSDWRNGLFWWIQSVYVIPEYRRRGVYRAMYDKVKKLASGDPSVCGFRLYVEKENLTAQKTYRDLGMDETAYRMFEEDRIES